MSTTVRLNHQTTDPQMFTPINGLGGYREDFHIDRNVVIIPTNAKPTSVLAAFTTYPKSGTQRQRVYDYIKSSGGATDEEIEHALNLSGNTVRPRRGTLVKDGLVVETDIERPTRAGNMAIVWMIKNVLINPTKETQ